MIIIKDSWLTSVWSSVTFLPQFQLVADLFQEGKDSSAPAAAGKSSKIIVRPAKPMPKGHNREHRKTVGTQVSLWGATKYKIVFAINQNHFLTVFFSSGVHYICWWRRWTLPLLTMCAALNPMIWKKLLCKFIQCVCVCLFVDLIWMYDFGFLTAMF